MLIGYARVSTGEQNLDLQLDALGEAGCEKVFTDKLSGAKDARPGQRQAMEYARPGDTIAVWRLDRFGRSLPDLVRKMEELREREIGFRSLTEVIDTSSASGKLQFHIFAALAEYERNIRRERTMAGLRAARARGRTGGRPRSMTESDVAMAQRLIVDPEISVEAICEKLEVSKSTLYRYVSPEGERRK